MRRRKNKQGSVAAILPPLHEGVEAAKAGNWDKAIESFNARRLEQCGSALILRSPSGNEVSRPKSKRRKLGRRHFRFQRSIEPNKENDAVALRFRASCLSARRQLERGAGRLRHGFESKESDGEALGRRAFVYMQLQDYDAALADHSAILLSLAAESTSMQLGLGPELSLRS